jgi:hypothetical protein
MEKNHEKSSFMKDNLYTAYGTLNLKHEGARIHL